MLAIVNIMITFGLVLNINLMQTYWMNKLGRSEYYLKDYWGEGADYMV